MLAAIVVSSLLFGASRGIEFQLQLSQMLVLLVVAAEVVVILSETPGTTESTLTARYYVPFALFAFLGLVSTYVNGELSLYYWATTCLTPLLLLAAIDRLAVDVSDVVRVLQAALTAILAFTAVVWVAQKTGHSQLMPKYGVAWRFADARAISIGPLSFEVFSIRLGSLAALGMPASVILAARTRRLLERCVYGAIILTFLVVLAFTAARGAIIGAVVGTLAAAVISRRFKLPRVLIGMVALGLLLTLMASVGLLDFLPSQGIARIVGLKAGLGSIHNFTYRVNVWDVTVHGIFSAPLGPGFQYLWYQYHLDEAVAYSVILNGTGILGFAAFVAILVQLARGYLRAAVRSTSTASNDLAAIGLGTMAVALLAGVSSQSVFVEPVQAIVLWSIMAATITGLARCHALSSAREAGGEAILPDDRPTRARPTRIPTNDLSTGDQTG